MAKNPKFGDIYEIKTKNGLVYVQYTNRHPEFGDLVRVIDGLFETRPLVFTEHVVKKESFYVFIFSIRTSLRWKQLELVGWAEVPNRFKSMPPFRKASIFADPNTGKVKSWSLWDNGKETKIGRMTSKYLDLSSFGIVNVLGLIDRLEDGYTPRTDIDVVGRKHELGPIRLTNKRNVISKNNPQYKKLTDAGRAFLDNIDKNDSSLFG